jgi:predicted acetyltransferase
VVNLKLVEPTMAMEQAYWDYVMEWQTFHEEIVPYSTRPLGRDYKTWLIDTEAATEEETCPSNFVPANTYFFINDQERILGAVNIRHRLNDQLLICGGHVGYGVRPSERKKGYAKMMLALSVRKCADLNIKEILLTCTKGNDGSARVIIANGGVLKDELQQKDNKVTQRYYIKL